MPRTPKSSTARAVPRLAYTLKEALATGAFTSRHKLYDAIARGELRTLKDGKRRLVTAASLQEYLKAREEAAA